jgi:hypothetical protein
MAKVREVFEDVLRLSFKGSVQVQDLNIRLRSKA